MYVVTVCFEVKEKYIDDFSIALLKQAKNSLELEDGCQYFDVCQNKVNHVQFFLYELYSSSQAFDSHLMTDHFKDFDAQTSEWVIDKRVATYSRLEK